MDATTLSRTAAGEREIMVGDSIVYHVITKDGIKTDKFDLKKD